MSYERINKSVKDQEQSALRMRKRLGNDGVTHAYRRSRDQHQKDQVGEKQEVATKEEMPAAAEKSDNHNNSLEYSESEQLQFSQPPKESQFHPGDVHASEPLPYIDEERESRSGLRQNL